MINLNDYVNNLHVSLDEVDESLKDKINNLEGYVINECCGCCCGCAYDEKIPNAQAIAPRNLFGRFNSIQDIIHELEYNIKVETLFDLFDQFTGYNFCSDPKNKYNEPLYFGRANCGGLNATLTVNNENIYKTVCDIVKQFELCHPVVYTKSDGTIQVYVVKTTGTNGEECSIKSSLEEIARLLGKLDLKSVISWSQVLDVSIDNADDLYAFVVTFTLDLDKI